MRLPERKAVSRPAVHAGHPDVPRLSVAVHLSLHQLEFGEVGQAGAAELTREDLVVVGVPVLLLVLRQLLEEALGDDVLDPVQIGLLCVAIV